VQIHAVGLSQLGLSAGNSFLGRPACAAQLAARGGRNAALVWPAEGSHERREPPVALPGARRIPRDLRAATLGRQSPGDLHAAADLFQPLHHPHADHGLIANAFGARNLF
jgi:nucleoside-diphosphate-sugar epimerase